MNFSYKTRYLFCVLIIIYLGFFLVYVSHLQKSIPSLLTTKEGDIDISNYFLNFFPNAIYGLLFMVLFFVLHLHLRIKLPDADLFILPAVAILSGIGLMMMLRLAPDLASARNKVIQAFLTAHPGAAVTDNVPNLARLGTKHFISIAVGALVMAGSIVVFNQKVFSWFSSKKYFWVFTSVLLVFITLLFGTEINRRRLLDSWISDRGVSQTSHGFLHRGLSL